MEMNFNLDVEQKQIISEKQILSLQVLAMSQSELSDVLQREYLENPLFDFSDDNKDALYDRLDDRYEKMSSKFNSYEEIVEDDDKRQADIPAIDRLQIENYILDQLTSENLTNEQWNLVKYMIACLDEHGFLTISCEEIAKKNAMDISEVRKILKLLQSLEPYGIFSKNIQECLLKQLEAAGRENSIEYEVTKSYLEEVGAGKISVISRGLKISTLEVRNAISEIRKLNPRPINELVFEKVDYIIPDVIAVYTDGIWEVVLNDKWVDNYRINDYYFHMMRETGDSELKSYFLQKYYRIDQIKKNIEQRRKTILEVSKELVKKQEKFLLGTGFLQTFTMADLSSILEIHASTVSRAVKDKYIQCPTGTFAMKDLFLIPIGGNDEGKTINSTQIKNLVLEIINDENKSKPLSDQAIVKLLGAKQINISRRAVAKYREELGIRGSFLRKE